MGQRHDVGKEEGEGNMISTHKGNLHWWISVFSVYKTSDGRVWVKNKDKVDVSLG